MEVYGDYEIESFLGKGSIGKVYLARHRRIGRRVALKTVHLEHKFEDDDDRGEFYKRLQREAELCASMQHPNIVTLYDVGYEGDVVSYLATEYVDGESLLTRLRRTRPLPLMEALSIATDLLRGLAYAHSKGIIHRDIKPANILLTSEGQAKIADFGVARPLHSSLTSTRTLVGTPNYMSPEQVKTTPVSPRSDLFSTGVVMYEMLTGAKPFAAPELSAILYNVVNLAPALASELNPAVPAPIARVVARLLSKAPEARYESAAAALADLEDASAGRRSRFTDADTIAILRDDATALTPLPTVIDHEPAVSMIRRPVPALVFWLVTLLLAAGLGAAVTMLNRSIRVHEKPTVVMTKAELDELASKRRALNAARSLTKNGRYEEAIRRYESYLARYPQSVVAAEERAEAERLLEASKPKAEVTRVAKKPAAKESQPAETEEKKPSRWQRFKRWFRGS